LAGESSAIDVEGFEDLKDLFNRPALAAGSLNNPQILAIFPTGFIKANDFFGKRVTAKASLKEPEIGVVKFVPEDLALQVLHPSLP
jgi:hypothetical protein